MTKENTSWGGHPNNKKKIIQNGCRILCRLWLQFFRTQHNIIFLFFILLYFMRNSNHSIVSRRKKERVNDIEDTCQLVWTKSHLASLSNLRAARHLDTSDSCSWVFVVLYQNSSPSLSDFHVHGVETTPTQFKLWPVVCYFGPVCAFCNTLPWDWQNVALMPFCIEFNVI